jgi:DNA-binding NtrC family response regulator
MPALFITQPDGVTVETFPLAETETRIGSGKMNHCRLDHPDVVADACVVVADGERWWLVDKTRQGIRFGAFLAREVELTHGAEFFVGPFRIRFDMDAAAEGPAAGADRSFVARTNPLAPEPAAPPGLVGQLREEGALGKPPCVLDAPSVTIGRGKDRTIVLNDASVSGEHCAIFRKGSDYFICDTGSLNGTTVNGLKLDFRKEVKLPDEATIKIGNRTFTFNMVQPAASALGDDGYEAPEFCGIVGATPRMKEIFDLLARYAPLADPVLVTGETGTGKELVARALHNLSHRKEEPYVARNCATAPRDLFESTFFGHEKGAFTGAQTMVRGVFELAKSGTLFLDEIGELPVEMQAKFLRVLEDGEFHRVGSGTPTKMHARVVAATNRNLGEMVEAGTFRRDLLERLDVLRIALPPLRERKEDILPLARYILKKMNSPKKFSQEAYVAMLACDWAGNVRDLRNALRRGNALCDGLVIQARHLDLTPATEKEKDETEAVYAQPVKLVEIEKKYILDVLERHGGHQEKTAKVLAIGCSTLRAKLRSWGIEPKKPR